VEKHDQTEFRLRLAARLLMPLGLALVVPIGAVIVVGVFLGSSVAAKVYFALWYGWVLGINWWVAFKEPRRIVAAGDCLRFIARARVIEIPWSSLQSVSVPWYEIGCRSLVWKWDGRKLRTEGWWENRQRLLGIVAERAPGAKVWV